jgi:hypothetical protein
MSNQPVDTLEVTISSHARSNRQPMIRLVTFLSLLFCANCADNSKGAALNECRLRYFLDSPDAQAQVVPQCMTTKSFRMDVACHPKTDASEWDWQVRTFTYDNQQCYYPIGAATSVATLLSPI